MSSQELSSLNNFKLQDYLPVILENLIDSIALPPPYDIICQISYEFNTVYDEIAMSLTDPYSVSNILNQIKLGKTDSTLKKFFETIRANNHFYKIDFDQFKRLFLQSFVNIGKMDINALKNKIEVFRSLIDYSFGDLVKIIKSKEFEVNDEKMKILYPQVLEAYERTLRWVVEKFPDKSLIDRISLFVQINFPANEESLIDFYEKNKSLLEPVFAVQKIENISILTRLLSEGANIDVGMLVKEALVFWRNEISDIIRMAKEEKRILKEEAKKKKIRITEEEIDLLYNEITPRFLENKNLKAILMEIKDKYQNKRLLAQIMSDLSTTENDYIEILNKKNYDNLLKHFDENQYEDKPILYFAILYKALIENQIDFLADIVKLFDENYFLKLAARKLLFIKMIQNSKIKNAVGENRVFVAFLNSFERIICNDNEPLNIRKENLLILSKMIIAGFQELPESFNNLLDDLFIKIFNDILDINLINKFATLKRITEKETEKLDLMKHALKLYELVISELSNRTSKTREQNRRNDFLLSKIERKLSNNVKKIKSRAITL